AFPRQPHFQVSGGRCRHGHRRAPRIEIPVVEGTTRQAKAPSLGIRWAWIYGWSGPAVERDGHAKQPVAAVPTYGVRASSGCVDTFWRCGRARANEAVTAPATISGVPIANPRDGWSCRTMMASAAVDSGSMVPRAETFTEPSRRRPRNRQ